MIKKQLLAIAIVLAGFSGVKAQKNTILLGGNVEFQSTKTGDNKSHDFNLSPFVGYQWDQHWTAGVGFTAGAGKTEVNNIQTAKYNSFGVSPFVRYTCPISPIFSTFVQADAGFLNTKFDDLDGKQKQFNANIIPYAAINIKNGLALNFSVGGISYGSTEPRLGGTKTNSFDINFGKQASVGISKNFNLKKKA